MQELLSRSYTKAELLRMQNDKLREIQEADTSIKMAELDLRKKQTEASDGSVYSRYTICMQYNTLPEKSQVPLSLWAGRCYNREYLREEAPPCIFWSICVP